MISDLKVYVTAAGGLAVSSWNAIEGALQAVILIGTAFYVVMRARKAWKERND